MEKFMFRKDQNVDWTSTPNEPFPLSTASHNYDIEWQKDSTNKDTVKIEENKLIKQQN